MTECKKSKISLGKHKEGLLLFVLINHPGDSHYAVTVVDMFRLSAVFSRLSNGVKITHFNTPLSTFETCIVKENSKPISTYDLAHENSLIST